MNSYQYAQLFYKSFPLYFHTTYWKKKQNRRNGLENNLIARKYNKKRLFHDMGYDSGNLNNQKMIEIAEDKHKP